MARLAIWLVVKQSKSLFTSQIRSGLRWVASINGSEAWPNCQRLASQKRVRPWLSLSSPCCQAASNPLEWAKPPAGKAESASCQMSHSFGDGKEGNGGCGRAGNSASEPLVLGLAKSLKSKWKPDKGTVQNRKYF